MAKMTAHLNIAISPKLRMELDQLASERSVPLSTLVRALLEAALENAAGVKTEPRRKKYEIWATPQVARDLLAAGYMINIPSEEEAWGQLSLL